MISNRFIEHQYIEFDNVLSYRTKVQADRLTALLEYIIHNADALGLEVTGNIMFTIFDSYELSDKRIFNIEIIAPVNKAFLSSERYIYKPKFRLVNGTSIRISNSTNELMDIRKKIMKYISDNCLYAISAVYYVASFSKQMTEIEYYDAVVSVSENIL